MKWFAMLFLTSIIKLGLLMQILTFLLIFFATALADKAAPGKGKMWNVESGGTVTTTTSMQQNEKHINIEHKITKELKRENTRQWNGRNRIQNYLRFQGRLTFF